MVVGNKEEIMTKLKKCSWGGATYSLGFKRAFTLAEVLITLAIIGVVAAMTVPTLITNYTSKQLEAQRKKVKYTLTNGFRLLMANQGASDLKSTTIASCDNDKDCLSAELRKTINIIQDVDDDSSLLSEKYTFTNGELDVWSNDMAYIFATADGTFYGIKESEDPTSGEFVVYVDLNGTKSPNQGGVDLCQFTITNSAIANDQCTLLKEKPVVELADLIDCPGELVEGYCSSCPEGYDTGRTYSTSNSKCYKICGYDSGYEENKIINNGYCSVNAT
ncbi:MAG: type II secretion system protein [Cyanobacteria bacterium SIG32]|nr:type II secretion system protein [Cyanobacteria bacterium SIG32]